MAKKDVKSDEIINYYKNIGRDKTAKRILEDPEYAEKMQKLWDKRYERKVKLQKEERTTSERTGGWQSGGRALRGYGRAYMKGGKV